jgi:hypothetical protein
LPKVASPAEIDVGGVSPDEMLKTSQKEGCNLLQARAALFVYLKYLKINRKSRLDSFIEKFWVLLSSFGILQSLIIAFFIILNS